MRPGGLAGGKQLPRVERLGKLERLRKARPIGGRKPVRERAEGGRAAFRMQLEYQAPALFYRPWDGLPRGGAPRARKNTRPTLRHRAPPPHARRFPPPHPPSPRA